MHEIKVDIVQSEGLQAHIEVLLDARVEGAPELGGYENITPFDLATCQCFFQTLANFIFVPVDKGAVDVTVADGDGVRNCFLDFSWS